jgi:hypothetical protein
VICRTSLHGKCARGNSCCADGWPVCESVAGDPLRGRRFAIGSLWQQKPAERGRRGRHAHARAASHAHGRRHHYHLQTQRPLRRRGAAEAQSLLARLAARRSDQDGSTAARPDLGSLPGGRRQGAGPDRVRFSLARHQRDAAPAQQGRGAVQPAHARQGDRLLHSRRVARADPLCRAAHAARRRRFLSDLGLAVRSPRHA